MGEEAREGWRRRSRAARHCREFRWSTRGARDSHSDWYCIAAVSAELYEACKARAISLGGSYLTVHYTRYYFHHYVCQALLNFAGAVNLRLVNIYF